MQPDWNAATVVPSLARLPGKDIHLDATIATHGDADHFAGLDSLERRVLLDVRRMRAQALGEKKGDARAGRRMALLSQLAISARIALEKMELRAVE